MNWRIVVVQPAQDKIRTLPPVPKRHIRRALDQLRDDPRMGKALGEELTGLYTFHVGRFRIIYQLAEHTITVVAVGPRPTIYEDLILARRYALPPPGHGYLADRPRRKTRRRRRE